MNLILFNGKKVLITGGTGSLGQGLTKKLLETDVETIRIYSRDELKQVEMNEKFSDKRLRYFIGDVRDKDRLSRALEDVNIVIHAAALKQVPVAEYNPFEAVKTNVYGAQNVVDGCFDNEVEIALAVGTDKAVSPFNTYGTTKLLMEKLFIAANYYKGFKHKVKFFAVRYGNVLGTRGSIVPTLVNQIQSGKKITITDPSMTRFNVTMPQALELIFRALKNGMGGEIFIPKLNAYKVEDMKNAILELMNSSNETEIIFARPGEKYHESLINANEIRNVYKNDDDYILYDKNMQSIFHPHDFNYKRASLSEEYSSDKVELLTKDEIKEILLKEDLVPVN